MSKLTKGTAPSKPQAPAKGIEVKALPFPNGIEAGAAIAACHDSYLAVADRMRATIGAAYNAATGFPQWAKLDAALTEAGVNFPRLEVQKGFAMKFDSMYGTGGKAATAPDAAKVERTQRLSKAVGYSAFDFRCLTPQAKAALGKDNPVRAEAVQDFSDMLNKFDSACYGGMVAADNKANGRMTRKGTDESKPIADRVKACKLGDVPALIGKLVEEGFDVPDAIRQLAAAIVKLKLANVKKA